MKTAIDNNPEWLAAYNDTKRRSRLPSATVGK